MTGTRGVGTLFYADGTTFKLPQIHTSSNGWVYKPDELRTDWERQRGKNKVFNRSRGHEEAQAFLENKLKNHFRDSGWAKPQAISNPIESIPRNGGVSYLVSWKDRTWGWVGVSLVVQPRNASYRHHNSIVKYTFHGHPVAQTLLRRTLTDDSTMQATIQVEEANEKEYLPRMVRAWRADPWGETLKAISVDADGAEQATPRLASWIRQGDGDAVITAIKAYYDEPSDEIKQCEYNGSEIGNYYEAARSGLGLDDNGFWSDASGNIRFFEKNVIKNILRDNDKWEILTELIAAFNFCGLEMSVTSDVNYNSSLIDGEYQRSITGFKITIPKQGETHRHVVSVSTRNLDPKVEVDCGYEDDERLWMERKQRQAAEQLMDLEREFGAFEINLGQEGKNDND